MSKTAQRCLSVIIMAVILRLLDGSTEASWGPYDPWWEIGTGAAVAFDGGIETLIVTTKLTAEDVRDLTWIIPIRSDAKPVVEWAKPDVLREINGILRGSYVPYLWDGRDLFAEAVAVLLTDGQASAVDVVGPGPGALDAWRKKHGLPREASTGAGVAPDAGGSEFFVVVHLGLAGLYQRDVDYVRRQRWLNSETELTAKVRTALASLNDEFEQQVAREILLQHPYEKSALSQNPLHQQYTLLSRREYDELVRQYGIGEEILLRTFRFDTPPVRFIDLWFRSAWYEITFCNGRQHGVLLFRDMYGVESQDYRQSSDQPVYDAKEVEEIRKLFAAYGPLVAERSRILCDRLYDKFRARPQVQPFVRLENLFRSLKDGLPISLRISFATRTPYIPAGVVGNGKGETRFTAYVFSNEPLKDRDRRLRIVKWESLGTAAKSRLSRYLPVYDTRAVSILSRSVLPPRFATEITLAEMDEREKTAYAEPGPREIAEFRRDDRDVK